MTKVEDQPIRTGYRTFTDGPYFDPLFSSGEHQVFSDMFDDSKNLGDFRKMSVKSPNGYSMYYRPGEIIYGESSRQVQLVLESEGDPSIAHAASLYVEGDNYYLSFTKDGGIVKDTRLMYDDNGIEPNRADILYYRNALKSAHWKPKPNE
ncbi:MAG TPA: hypothetical protein VG917_05425 [Patescibacteria group bacterium]|nr:hypothetical protein [Patescibacteria group bacterium]